MFQPNTKANCKSLRPSALTMSALMLAGLFASCNAIAQNAPNDGGQIGLAAISTYEYKGSDQSSNIVAPMLEYEWSNGWFAGIRGVGHKWTFGEQLEAGVKVAYEPGREENRSAALKGLGDVDSSGQFGVFVQYALGGGFATKSNLLMDLGMSNKGLMWDLGLQFGSPIGRDWRFGAEVTATYANKDYMQSFFGVTAKQSQASGYSTYEPSAGLRDLAASVALTYIVTPTVSFKGVISNSSLKGDARNAPMVRSTSATSSLVALTYAF